MRTALKEHTDLGREFRSEGKVTFAGRLTCANTRNSTSSGVLFSAGSLPAYLPGPAT